MELLRRIEQENGVELCRVSVSSAVCRRRFYMQHRHAILELSLIRSGTGRYRAGDREYEIAPGDIFLYSANEQHCITDADELHLVNVHFSPRFFWRTGEPSFSALGLYFRRSPDFSNRVAAEHPVAREVAQHIGKIECEARQGLPDSDRIIYAELVSALVALHRGTDMADKAGEQPSGGESLSKVSSAIDYIEAHITEPITLSDIAAEVHLTRTYLSALFRRSYGMPIWDYIHLRRIATARRYLAESEMTVLDVALRSGFNNTANFNRTFLKLTGMTPGRYREEMRP